MATPQRMGVEAVLTSLSTTRAPFYLLGLVERCIAVVLHMSFSVLVWFGVKERPRRYLYPLAILLHAAVDATAVVLSQSGVSALLIELLLILLSVLYALLARHVWRARSAVPE